MVELPTFRLFLGPDLAIPIKRTGYVHHHNLSYYEEPNEEEEAGNDPSL
jgi:hypothetical protein